MRMIKRNFLLIAISMCVVVSCCECIKTTDPDMFKPKDYEDFIYKAYLDFWSSLSNEEQLNINSASWNSFIDMRLNYFVSNIDVELEFIYRMLMNDELWEKYEITRKVYEKEYPAKTYKDQIAEIIKTCWQAVGLVK